MQEPDLNTAIDDCALRIGVATSQGFNAARAAIATLLTPQRTLGTLAATAALAAADMEAAVLPTLNPNRHQRRRQAALARKRS